MHMKDCAEIVGSRVFFGEMAMVRHACHRQLQRELCPAPKPDQPAVIASQSTNFQRRDPVLVLVDDLEPEAVE